MPLEIDPGLIYGIVYLDWKFNGPNSWEHEWDKASVRLTYIKNFDYENLQTSYASVLSELLMKNVLMYVFLGTTGILAISTFYFYKKAS